MLTGKDLILLNVFMYLSCVEGQCFLIYYMASPNVERASNWLLSKER